MTSDPDHKRVMEGIRTFYNKFTKAMEQILAQYNGKILKATLYWNGLACYFPKTSDYTDEDAIKDVLECCLKQIERQESLSIVLACGMRNYRRLLTILV